jgi:hypothetical protein
MLLLQGPIRWNVPLSAAWRQPRRRTNVVPLHVFLSWLAQDFWGVMTLAIDGPQNNKNGRAIL